MRLTDLDPRWVIDADIIVGGGQHVHNPNRIGMGISFECPHCVERERSTGDKRVLRLAVFFANPVDGGLPADGGVYLWTRAGETFDTLTLTLSVDASSDGHWHGHLKAGEVTSC